MVTTASRSNELHLIYRLTQKTDHTGRSSTSWNKEGFPNYPSIPALAAQSRSCALSSIVTTVPSSTWYQNSSPHSPDAIRETSRTHRKLLGKRPPSPLTQHDTRLLARTSRSILKTRQTYRDYSQQMWGRSMPQSHILHSTSLHKSPYAKLISP